MFLLMCSMRDGVGWGGVDAECMSTDFLCLLAIEVTSIMTVIVAANLKTSYYILIYCAMQAL